MRKILFILIFLLSIAFVRADFVTVNGTEFIHEGKPFYFAGANAYYLWYGNWNCGAYDPNQGCSKEVMDDAVDMNLSVLRVWGFADGLETSSSNYWGALQPLNNTYNENRFEQFDRLLKEASERNISLIIPFVNNWNEFGGMCQYVKWSNESVASCSDTSAEHDSFYTNNRTRELYKGYVSYFLNRMNTETGIRYKDDPTIFAWELANEPRAKTDPSQTILDNWIEEMSIFVKGIDNNHLLTVGVEGFTDPGEGTDFIKNHLHDNIDYASFHLLVNDWGFSYLQSINWINSHIDDALALGLPIVLEEIGKYKPRYSYYDGFFNLTENNTMNGDLIWMLKDANYPDNYGVDYPEEVDVTDRIILHANRMNNKSRDDSVNHAPNLVPISDINAFEGELAVITAIANDIDGDGLTYYISDNRFSQNNNEFSWQTQAGDIGLYEGFVTVSDGEFNATTPYRVIVTPAGSSCTVPIDGTIYTTDTVFCPGTYPIGDRIGVGSGVKVACDGTTLLGNRSRSTIYVGNGGEVHNCNIKNFFKGLGVGYGDHNLVIINNTFENCSSGLHLHKTEQSNFSDNTFKNCGYGVYIEHSRGDNYFVNNLLLNSSTGFRFDWYADNDYFIGNKIYNSVFAGFSHDISWKGVMRNNTFIGNELMYNKYAFYLGSTADSLLKDNYIANNDNGIRLYGSANNTIFHNNFINNIVQVVYPENNIWDNGSQGNYWSDYDETSEGCLDPNNDGICDSPYNIGGGVNADNYPFTDQDGWEFRKFTLNLNLGWNLISSPLNFTNLTKAFLPIQPYFESMFVYDGEEQEFVEIDPFIPREINLEHGAWLKVNESVNLTIVGDKFENKDFLLFTGWNLVPYPSLTGMNINESLLKDYAVYSYVDGEWFSYIPNNPLNTLTQFIPGYGYWVKSE